MKVVHKSFTHILSPKPECCPACATRHEPELPHNLHSLFYQMAFLLGHKRDATWEDAMAHCTEEMKVRWRVAMAEVEAEYNEVKAE